MNPAQGSEIILPDGVFLPKNKNEGEDHFRLKNLLYGYLKAVGCKKIKEEVSHGNLRFDLEGLNPNGTSFAVEIGNMNVKSDLLKTRIKNSFKYVDMVFWVPYGYTSYSRHADVLRACPSNEEGMVDGFMGDPNIEVGNIQTFKTGHSIIAFYNMKILDEDER